MAPLADFLRSGLGRRILSALVLAPPVLAAMYFGSPWVHLMLALAVVQMAREWVGLCAPGPATPALPVLAGGGVVAIAAAWQFGYPAAFAIAGATMLAAFVAGLGRGRTTAFWLAAGAPVAILPCLAFLWLRFGLEEGRTLGFWLLAAVWATDIGAYAVGRTVGGPKLWRRVSPNKTWSGLLGGVIAAALVGIATSWLMAGDRALALALAGAAIAVISQGGDLAESAVKRRFGVKDAGNMIPGHGGLLDRVDGLLTAIPATALALWLIGGEVLPWK